MAMCLLSLQLLTKRERDETDRYLCPRPHPCRPGSPPSALDGEPSGVGLDAQHPADGALPSLPSWDCLLPWTDSVSQSTPTTPPPSRPKAGPGSSSPRLPSPAFMASSGGAMRARARSACWRSRVTRRCASTRFLSLSIPLPLLVHSLTRVCMRAGSSPPRSPTRSSTFALKPASSRRRSRRKPGTAPTRTTMAQAGSDGLCGGYCLTTQRSESGQARMKI